MVEAQKQKAEYETSYQRRTKPPIPHHQMLKDDIKCLSLNPAE